MKAFSQTVIRSNDPDGGTKFIAAEHEHLSKYEDSTLRELLDEVRAGDLTQDQLDTIEQFVDLVRERRTKFASTVAARKSRIGSIRK